MRRDYVASQDSHSSCGAFRQGWGSYTLFAASDNPGYGTCTPRRHDRAVTHINDLGTITKLALTAIKPAPDNPRQIPKRAVEVVAESLKAFGWQQPLVVDADHILIVGHTRLLAAKHLKLAEAPVIVATDLTPDQVRAYRIADNRTGDFTTWDYPVLVDQLDQLATDFGDVLALADWESIVDSLPDTTVDTSPETDAALTGEFGLTVICESAKVRDLLAAKLIDEAGVFDVRHKR